jgi:hypothetical protein
MPLSPTIALTITLKDMQGVALGAVGTPAFVEIALANYGPTLPRISGTSMIAKVFQTLPYTGSPITVNLFGNDVITPVGTYYVITIYDDEDNVLQTGAYVFNGSITADLSTLPQSFPSATSSVQGSEVDVVFSATPTFDCTQVNGPVEFYIVLTGNVTSSTLLPNFAGQLVTFRIQQDATGGRTFVWPTNVKNPPTIGAGVNQVTTQAFCMGSDGNAYPIASGLPAGGGGSGSAQIGDIIQFNVAGDGNWDSVNYAQVHSALYAVFGGTVNPIQIGFFAGFGRAGSESTGTVNPTAGLGAGMRFFLPTGNASVNTLAGWRCSQNGNNSNIPILAWYRLSTRLQLDAVVGTPRYWHGLTTWNSGGAGTNGAAILGTTKFATDTPNSNFIGWRYSVGVDTHWQAVTITAGGSMTLVDTGVTPDANPHLFEITQNSGGTTLYFWIDRVLVATISTNIPSATPGNAGDGECSPFVSADNKNSGTTAIGTTTYSCLMSHKQ